MPDEMHGGLIRMGGNKPFRKKRATEGEKWKPGRKNDPNNEIGPYCFKCSTIHPWKSPRTLKAVYEKQQGDPPTWHILWTCVRTGEVLKTERLTTGGGAAWEAKKNPIGIPLTPEQRRKRREEEGA